MYLTVIILPLLSSLLIGFFGYFFGRQISIIISIYTIIICFILANMIFYEIVLCNSVVTLKVFNWLSLSYVKLNIGILFDSLTATMLVVVLTISLYVHIYSIDYMSHDPYIVRFLVYLGLFTFFMIFLITSDNFIQLFIGWEGVGVSSYLLINFWYTRILANKAALKAMIMNRIADVFFLFGIVLIIINFKTADFIVVFSLVEIFSEKSINFILYNIKLLDLICIFLFIGAIGKSAQIGFHTWLPDAMEGPTPVSALLHAATMVTAGVFLIIRCSFIFEYSSIALNLITLIGGITAFFSALVAVFQYDIKKIIAYSTCSQLGYMFFSCGLSNYQIAFFHLFNHAFFKALLFLAAGCIISALFDEQDIRKMGGLANYMPLTYISFLIGSLAIAGFPFLTGFYSKDIILEITLTRYLIDSSFIYLLGILSALLTALYSTRLIFFVFFFKNNRYNRNPIEENNYMKWALIWLSIFSIFVGYIFSDIFCGWGSTFFSESIYISNKNIPYIDHEFLNTYLKNIPLIFSIIGFLIGIYIQKIINRNYINYIYIYNLYSFLSKFFYNASFFNYIYNTVFLELYKFSYFFNTKIIDKGFLEFIGPYGIYKIIKKLSYFSRIYSPNALKISIFFMFINIVIILSYIFLNMFILNYIHLFVFIICIYFIELKNIEIG